MTLKFYVKNQTLAYCGNDIVASGSKNYLYASFRFTREWAGVAKTAVFVSADGSNRYHMLLEGGRCSVPAQMIAEGGFYVSVFGGDRITSTQVYIDVAQSGIEPGLTPPEPTEDVYNQILEKVDELSAEIGSLYVTGDMIADGAVSEAKLADSSVSEEKLADGAVGEEKLTDGAVSEGKLAEAVSKKLHTHLNKSELDKINAGEWDRVKQLIADRFEIVHNAYEFSEFADKMVEGWYDFPFAVGELFEIYNETETSVSQLYYNDEAVWKFSAPIETGKRYLLRITQRPVTGADVVHGAVEVIRETAVDDTAAIKEMYDLVCELSADVKTLENADTILVGLIEEGV